MSSLLSIFAVVAAYLVNNVAANSIGTGSCAAGISAIGGTHLDFGPDSVSKRMGILGTVFEGATEIRINGILLTANTPASFPPNTDLTWTAEAMVSPFKGLFVRVQAADDNVFTHTGVSEGLQSAALCDLLETNVIGISHNSATPKVLSSGVMNFSGEGSVTMDISLVFDNVATAVSAFSSYHLTIELGAPVPAPIAPVAPSPLAMPITTPESIAPVASSPLALPTVDRTTAPIHSPSPIDTPIMAPLDAHVPSPLYTPIELPVTVPVPVEAPVDTSKPINGSTCNGKGKGGKGGKVKGGNDRSRKGGMMMGKGKGKGKGYSGKGGKGKGKGYVGKGGKGKGKGYVGKGGKGKGKGYVGKGGKGKGYVGKGGKGKADRS